MPTRQARPQRFGGLVLPFALSSVPYVEKQFHRMTSDRRYITVTCAVAGPNLLFLSISIRSVSLLPIDRRRRKLRVCGARRVDG